MLTLNDYETLLHEIKNAVTVISCSLQLVEKQHPEVRDYAFWSDTSLDLLDLRKLLIDVASMHLCDLPQKKNVKIDHFLQELKTACPKTEDSGHPLIINQDQNLTEGYFDASRTQQALLRILDNAFDALNGDGQVQLNAYPKDNGLVFEVKDNGRGIAADALPQICQPFFGSGNGKPGLGLFIAKGIIDSQDGILTVSSELAKGTTVSIFLPLDTI